MKKTSYADPRPFFRFTQSLLVAWLSSLAGLCIACGSVFAQTNLYWDQNGATTGIGGTGNWGTASTWRAINDTGTLQNWDNAGTATANLGGTAGTLTIDVTSGVSMAALNVTSSGYTIQSTANSRPLSVSGALTLADGAGLTLAMASTGPTWGFGSMGFGSGAALSVSGNATASNSNRVNLSTTSTSSGGSITLSGTGAGPTGFVASAGSSVSVTLNTNILNNSATSATMLGAGSGHTLNYGGVISGSARLQISAGQTTGAGIVVLANNNTFTGDTYLNHATSGVLRLGIADALPTATTLNMAQSAGGGTADTGGTLDLAGFNQTLAGVNGAGRGIVNTGSAATLTLSGAGTYSMSSVIGIPASTTNLSGANNNIAVTKSGLGTQTLAGASTYSGGTTLSGGTLLVTNTSGSATGTGSVTTASSTTLGGTGTLAPTGSSSVIFGGGVTPGVTGSAGTLSFTPVNGNVTFQSTSSIVFELFGNGSNDKIVHAATGAGVLDFSAMTSGSIGVTFAGGYTPGLGHTFDLLDWSGVSGLSASQLSLSTAGFDPSWAWDLSQFTTNGTLSIVLVPEPGRGAMVMAGLAAWRMRRRR